MNNYDKYAVQSPWTMLVFSFVFGLFGTFNLSTGESQNSWQTSGSGGLLLGLGAGTGAFLGLLGVHGGGLLLLVGRDPGGGPLVPGLPGQVDVLWQDDEAPGMVGVLTETVEAGGALRGGGLHSGHLLRSSSLTSGPAADRRFL